MGRPKKSHVVGEILPQPAESAMDRHLEEKRLTVEVLPAENQADPDTVINTIEKVVSGIIDGGDVSASFPEIARLIANQEQRAELLTNLIQTQDYKRLGKFLRAQNKLENEVLACAMRDDLSPAESFQLLELIGPETEKLKNKVKSGTPQVKDIEGILNKLDYALQMSDDEIRKKFSKNTTPQGREITRRLIHKLTKAKRAADGN
jgi:hypothetical protein